MDIANKINNFDFFKNGKMVHSFYFILIGMLDKMLNEVFTALMVGKL